MVCNVGATGHVVCLLLLTEAVHHADAVQVASYFFKVAGNLLKYYPGVFKPYGYFFLKSEMSKSLVKA
jgi:hypothetical protein